MGRVLQIPACSGTLVTVLLMLNAAGAGVVPGSIALAQGTGTSAGDQQYVDPLSGSTGTSTHPSTTPATSSPSASGPSSSPAAAGAASSASGSRATATSASATPTSTSATPAGARPSSTSSQNDSSGTLPFTGLNVETFVVAGVGLLGAGLLLRWIATRTY